MYHEFPRKLQRSITYHAASLNDIVPISDAIKVVLGVLWWSGCPKALNDLKGFHMLMIGMSSNASQLALDNLVQNHGMKKSVCMKGQAIDAMSAFVTCPAEL